MRSWFEGLAERERLILSAGALLAVVILIWGFVWRPLNERALELRETVAEKSRFVVDLNRAKGLDPTTQSAVGVDTTQSLAVIVDTTARPFSLDATFSRRRLDGPNAISVSFDRAPFDRLVAWLVELEQSYGTAVEQVSFTGSGQPGLVNGQVFLRRR